ncbi:unnamed protein product [Zymoseptoria tritici ST99CH_1E4]|uniref:F-box domain-containing protein n=1 Tax=Zymoseptoria tritici ST99CH_1E4 TaxID=1276532 RepID=A0A2H1FJN5_ZYMTR|nr:unnamed protein product [Zymoseptoria tritici ST99CH_1E4]
MNSDIITTAMSSSAGDHSSRSAAGPASAIETLPEELLSFVVGSLDPESFGALRETCRSLEAKTLRAFATQCFSSKSFIFTTESLETLAGIASHPVLSKSLKEVSFLTVDLQEKSLKCGSTEIRARRPTFAQRDAYLAYVDDQQQLQRTGEDKGYITSAFSRLPAMRRLSIVDSEFSPANKGCWGLAKLLRKTGMSLKWDASRRDLEHLLAAPRYEWLSHVFSTVMLSTVASNSSVTTLQTPFACERDGLSPFDLNFGEDTMQLLSMAFSKLKNLKLHVRTKDLPFGKGNPIEAVASFAPFLEKVDSLRLVSDHGRNSGTMVSALLGDTARLQYLTTFCMDFVTIETEKLVGLLSQTKSLRTLSLEAVNISAGGGWMPVLKLLASEALALHHLHLMFLEDSGRRVYLLEQANDQELEEWWALRGSDSAAEDDESDSDDSDDSDDLVNADDVSLAANANEQVNDPIEAVGEDVEDVEDLEDLEEQNVAAKPATHAPANARCKASKASGLHYTVECFPPHTPERGYFVCFDTRERILAELPRCIAECNINPDEEDGSWNESGLRTGIYSDDL